MPHDMPTEPRANGGGRRGGRVGKYARSDGKIRDKRRVFEAGENTQWPNTRQTSPELPKIRKIRRVFEAGEIRKIRFCLLWLECRLLRAAAEVTRNCAGYPELRRGNYAKSPHLPW